MSEIAALLKAKRESEDVRLDKMPIPGSPTEMWVVYMWGDPIVLGSPAVPMMAMVTSVQLSTGLVNGWAFSDPSIRATDPAGRPVQFPPLLPIVGSSYNTKPVKLSWMTLKDFGNLQVAAPACPTGGEANADV